MAQYIEAGDENYGALEDFCDAILKTEDGCAFKVHQVILAKSSSYFRTRFLFRGRAQSNAEFTLSGCSGRVVKQILHYLYSGQIFFEADNIVELMLSADYFLLDDLFFKCQSFAKENLSLRNCLKIFIASHSNDRLDIYNCSRRFIFKNFTQLLDQPTGELSDIPFELFKTLLEDIVFLNIPDETYIWIAVEQWVNNSSERIQNVPELLSTIRFRNLNGHLVQYLQKSDILRKNPYMKELNDVSLTENLPESCEHFKNVLSSKYLKRDITILRQPKRLYLIANITSEEIVLFVAYKEDICIRRKITSKVKDFNADYIIVVDHLVYIFDCTNGITLVFNLLEKTWKYMKLISRLNSNHFIVHKGQFIYVGNGKFEPPVNDLSDVPCTFDRYDTKSQTWKHLECTANIHKAALIGNKIYISSKNPLTRVWTIVEYDTMSETFSKMPAPEGTRQGRGLTAYDGQLFFFLLRGGQREFDSVEAFSPETRVWKKFPTLPYRLRCPGAKVFADKLVVFDCCAARNCPPVFWNKKAKVWKPFQSKYFESNATCLCIHIDDCDTITYLMNENFNCEQKWEFFENEIF